jgi:hypothetical protein
MGKMAEGPDPPSMLFALLRTGSPHLNRGFRDSQDFRSPSPRQQPERSTALPAVAWLTLAPRCKADVGPQTRSAVRTFVDPPLQPRSPRASWRAGLAPCPRLAEKGRPARRVAPVRSSHCWPGVSPSCARPRMTCPARPPDGPNWARSATTALDCQLAQVTRDGSCFRSAARCTRPKRRFCRTAHGSQSPFAASLWAPGRGRS